MAVQSQHIAGFAVGLGVAALGFYLYKQNQEEVDRFLHEHGIEMPSSGAGKAEDLTLEQLVAEKERLEDLIAEREYEEQQRAEAAEPPAEAPPAAQPRKKRAPRKKSAAKA